MIIQRAIILSLSPRERIKKNDFLTKYFDGNEICSPLSSSFLFQLYEINDDPKRKEFLDDLFSYMQKRGKSPKGVSRFRENTDRTDERNKTHPRWLVLATRRA